MIAELTILMFFTQVAFIAFRTWNVREVANKNTKGVLISGTLVHWSWLVGIAIGANSMHKIIVDFQWEHMPIIIASTVGSLIGAWIGMQERKKRKY